MDINSALRLRETKRNEMRIQLSAVSTALEDLEGKLGGAGGSGSGDPSDTRPISVLTREAVEAAHSIAQSNNRIRLLEADLEAAKKNDTRKKNSVLSPPLSPRW